MKTIHQDMKTMRPISQLISRSAIALCALALASASVTSCGSDIKCGEGTTLDATTNECIPSSSGDLNVIVGDFKLGKFAMTNVDVPERLEVGTPDTRTFTITNKGTDARAVVSIRYGIVPVKEKIEELRDALDEADDSSTLDATIVGNVIIENLAAGETRSVSYGLSVPNSVKDGLYGLYFALDEVPLKKGDDGQYQVDFSVTGLAKQDGTVRVDDAALVYAPATVIVGKPDKANLRVLFANLDNASFELDNSEKGNNQIFNLSGRMSAQALDITEPVSASFELKLPGHVVDVPGQDLGRGAFATETEFNAAPAKSTFKYDANRKFPLFIRQGDGFAASKTYDQKCESHEESVEGSEETTTVETCAVIFNDQGRDDVYQLHLQPSDVRLLERTRELAAFNTTLDANHEIHGQLVMTVATTQAEYQDNKADNEMTFDVVFMAPEAAAAATANDQDNGGVTTVPNGYGDAGPYPYVLTDNVSSNGFGNEWFGASYRFATNSSYNKHKGSTIAHYESSDNSFRATILKANVPILTAGGTVDWGSDKGMPAYKASGSLGVFGYTLLNATFDPSFCQTDSNNLTLCPVFEANAEGSCKQGKCDEPDKKVPPKKKGRELSKSWEIHFQAGPVPLMIKTDAGIASGVKFVGQFAIDRRGPAPKYGVQFSFGPWAALEVTVFGGVSIGVARAGVEGNLKIIEVEFLPTLRPTIGALYDSGRDCFKYADASIAFEGPFTLRGPSGSVGVAAYAGFRICFFGRCIKGEKKVFSFTIASFETFTKTWYAWQMEPRWRKSIGDEGMCSDALDPGPTVAWRSPTSCSNSYCANSSTNKTGSLFFVPSTANVLAAYKSTYTLVNGARCVDVLVNGTTRDNKDRVVLYDASGSALNTETVTRCIGWLCIPVGFQYGWSGALNRTVQVCSTSVTAALESSDGSVVGYPGVTVTFTPSF